MQVARDEYLHHRVAFFLRTPCFNRFVVCINSYYRFMQEINWREETLWRIKRYSIATNIEQICTYHFGKFFYTTLYV
jgi:hypothetical protein